jgi:hypothetical protein
VCQVQGLRVDIQTVKALLTERARARFACVPHRFCRSAACPVVYYDEVGHTFSTDDVRARVWHKENFGDRTICFCFGESERRIRQELERDNRCDAVDRVRGHIRAGRCACDVRNPRGVRCLADLIAAVERVHATLAAHREMP